MEASVGEERRRASLRDARDSAPVRAVRVTLVDPETSTEDCVEASARGPVAVKAAPPAPAAMESMEVPVMSMLGEVAVREVGAERESSPVVPVPPR